MALFIYLSIYAFVFAPMVIPPVTHFGRTALPALRCLMCAALVVTERSPG